MELIRIFSAECPFDQDTLMKGKAEDLTDQLHDQIWKGYLRKIEHMARQAYPVVKNVFETKAEIYQNIVVPISDGHRVFQRSEERRVGKECRSRGWPYH